NEDIRVAIIQIFNVVRATDDKLERHEYRGRAVSEQLKKGMLNIDKRIKMLDPLKGTVSRLDERLAAVETILMQKDERERIQLQKNLRRRPGHTEEPARIICRPSSCLDPLHWALRIEIHHQPMQIYRVERVLASNEPPAEIKEPVMSKKDFEKMEREVLSKMDRVASTIGNMENELFNIRDENKNIKDIHSKSSENMEKVKRQLDTSEQLLAKYENKLAEYNNKIPEIPVPNYKEQDEWRNNFLRLLESQKSQVKEILSDVKMVKDSLQTLPQKEDIESAQNTTTQKLEEMKQESALLPETTVNLLKQPYGEMRENLDTKHNETLKNINVLFDIMLGLSEGFSNSYEKIVSEIQGLSKLEQVMVQTADSVLDTKRRVEYGVHQIIAEVSNQVKESAKDVTQAVNDRFDSFEISLLDDETGALTNLSSKLGEDIDQVWRQMGVMHQQMSVSTDTLNNLQDQTNTYVNGTIKVMDNMKGKVGQITGKMTEVDDNLNYLLGRLSLVTQEFNRIKSGLGAALNEIRDSFHAVQDKIKETKGNGPHKIESSEVDSSRK
ncbi:hypothetical protein NQ318_020478, partial [Aromia moschata]